MRKIWLVSILVVIVAAGIGCSKISEKETNNTPPKLDRGAILLEAKKNNLIMDDSQKAQMADPSVLESDKEKIRVKNMKSFLPFSTKKGRSGALADVTEGTSYGLANVNSDGNVFTVSATAGGLPPLSDKYFYEGWIVKRGSDMQVLSTGKLETTETDWINVYQTTQDLSRFDFYVVTLEPDDNDPAPAEHILEGIIR